MSVADDLDLAVDSVAAAELVDEFADTASRQRVMSELAPVAIAFDLRRLRRAVRGDAGAEADLLRLLRASGVGQSVPLTGDVDELEARLATMPLLPDVGKRDVLVALSEATDVRERARLRTVLGGVSPSTPASPVADFPIVIDAPGSEPIAAAELAQLLVADLRRQATHSIDHEERAVIIGRVARADALTRDGAFDENAWAAGVERFVLATDDVWPSVGRDFTAWQRAVIALLLREIDLEDGGPDDGDWIAWARRPLHRDRHWRQRMLRVGLAVAMVLAFTAISLLPKAPPGQLPVKRLTPPAALCSSCPANQRLDGVGVLAGEGRRYVNLRFGAPPSGATARIELQSRSGSLVLTQAAAHNHWTVSVAPVGGLPASLVRDTRIDQRGRLVVVSIPKKLEPRGVAVTSQTTRVPTQGFVEARGRPSAHVNLVDVLLLALFAVAVWRGYRRGLLAALPIFAGFLFTLLFGRVLYRALGRVFAHVVDTHQAANAIALSVLVGVVGLGVSMAIYAAMGRILPPVVRWMGVHTPIQPGRPLDSWLGTPIAFVRAAMLTALLLVTVTDLAPFSWARVGVEGSVTGRALLSVWRALYPGV